MTKQIHFSANKRTLTRLTEIVVWGRDTGMWTNILALARCSLNNFVDDKWCPLVALFVLAQDRVMELKIYPIKS